ncbi:hypothetical protein F5877DRAFT_84343 [Lentinula edodes]|nr:hypothetical protein F5877DRAFT_84343 [Lentinula edodes]
MSFGSIPNIPRLPDTKHPEYTKTTRHEATGWGGKLETVQTRNSVRSAVKGTDRLPRPNSYLGPIYPLMTQAATPLFSPMPCLKEWEVHNRLVAGAIVLNITDPVGLGVDETKRASEIWLALIKCFKKRDEQRIHLADMSLCQEKYNPLEDTMEDHKKRMRNLLKKVHDLGGTASDTQFRHIVISSMPPEWRQDVQSIPGSCSTDVFTYLHTLWYEKEEEQKETERDTKCIKALMATHFTTPTNQTNLANQARTGGKPAIVCHNCSKPGHIVRKCWAKGEAWKDSGQSRDMSCPVHNQAHLSTNHTFPYLLSSSAPP